MLDDGFIDGFAWMMCVGIIVYSPSLHLTCYQDKVSLFIVPIFKLDLTSCLAKHHGVMSLDLCQVGTESHLSNMVEVILENDEKSYY